jgi:hypothetical protein
MESFIRDASTYTPSINFIPELRMLELKGVSLPENVIEFYSPVIEWLERFENEYADTILQEKDRSVRLVFKLSYYNSGTIRYLIAMLNKMKRLIDRGIAVTIEWHYDAEDEHLLDSGKELSELTELPFIYVESADPTA